MPEFLDYGFMQRALIAGGMTALICPAIGVFLVPRRLSLIADTLAHVALAGVALGLVVGISPVVGALAATTAGAIGIERLRMRGGLAGDASLAVFLSGGLAVAVVLIGLGRGFNVDLFAVLFGSILTVTVTDLWLIGGLGVVVALAIGVLYPRLLAVTLDEELARASGVPVATVNLVIAMLTALTTVIAMRMVGVLLVSAMIVIPALAGFALARSFRGALLTAMGVAVLAMGTGLVLAYYLRLAAGASVVLTALGLFALAVPLGRRWGHAGGRAVPAVVALGLLASVVPGEAAAPECERWRRAFAGMPRGTIVVEAGLRRMPFEVRLAGTPEEQAAGFQCASPREIASTLILFDFGAEVLTRFHMQNVAAALDIAFVKADGRIFATLSMEANANGLYGPTGPFRYALEAPAGFFARHGIRSGSMLHAGPALVAEKPPAERRHAHRHGAARLQVTLEGRALQIALDSPADNLLGFEHAPRTDVQKKTVARVEQQLRQSTMFFAIPPAADCQAQPVTVEVALPAAGSAETHSEIEVEWRWHCARPEALTHVDVGLFKAFPRLKELRAQVVTARDQRAVVLKASATRLRLAW